jgi:hypothetical protein
MFESRQPGGTVTAEPIQNVVGIDEACIELTNADGHRFPDVFHASGSINAPTRRNHAIFAITATAEQRRGRHAAASADARAYSAQAPGRQATTVTSAQALQPLEKVSSRPSPWRAQTGSYCIVHICGRGSMQTCSGARAALLDARVAQPASSTHAIARPVVFIEPLLCYLSSIMQAKMFAVKAQMAAW